MPASLPTAEAVISSKDGSSDLLSASPTFALPVKKDGCRVGVDGGASMAINKMVVRKNVGGKQCNFSFTRAPASTVLKEKKKKKNWRYPI